MYQQRIAEIELSEKLAASGAVLIKGPKSCGKTETAKRFANSILQVDRDPTVPITMSVDPQLLLEGDTPRLIDEWQEQPKLWNYVRHEVDDRKQSGQFILTGSANPSEDVKLHSGAGRFTIVEMQTMSWQELGYSSGKISLADLLTGSKINTINEQIKIEQIVERIVQGGFPTTLGKSLKNAMLINRTYIDLLAEVDMSRVSNMKRDTLKVRALLSSLSRNTATLVDNSTLEKDIKQSENIDISRPTIIDYLDTLRRLMILEEQPAFSASLHSATPLRKLPKRHLCDVGLAVAALKFDKEALLKDLKFCGFLFESLVYHDLKVYAHACDAEVFHYRDASGLEIDSVVKQANGNVAAFEVKLGTGQIDEAAAHLLKFESVLQKKPQSLNIITGTGFSYRRPDGINVISMASLGK